MEQLTLFTTTERDPLTCAHNIGELCGRVMCDLRAGESGFVCTNCNVSIAGEPPHCVYEPLDNSPATVARRKRWREQNGDIE